MSMDLRVLELFCRIVELKTFSRAAEAASLTQPTVSEHIKSLEAGVGVAVISRRAIEEDVRSGLAAIVAVRGLRMPRELYLVTHRSRTRSPAAEAFLAFLRGQAGESSRQAAGAVGRRKSENEKRKT